jgi:hypothetical protein
MGYFASVPSAQPVMYQCMTEVSRRLSNHMGLEQYIMGVVEPRVCQSLHSNLLDLDDMAVVEPRVSQSFLTNLLLFFNVNLIFKSRYHGGRRTPTITCVTKNIFDA